VGNRTVLTDTSGTQTYSYDAANRLTHVDGITYTWDMRGNLINDGVYTYTYDGAGRMVQAQSVTLTLVYTYNADGLRVAQDVSGTVTAFVWDWATPVPELVLSVVEGKENVYLVGLDTVGWWDGEAWTFALPDALGSVRQTADITGTVTANREWSPFGVAVDGAQAGLGYTGEWWDDGAGLLYLRARWYEAQTGRFTQRDVREGKYRRPQSLNRWTYVEGNPVLLVDPSGYSWEWDTEMEENVIEHKPAFLASARRHNPFLPQMDNNGFAALIATTIAAEKRMGNIPIWQEERTRSRVAQTFENTLVNLGCVVSGKAILEACLGWAGGMNPGRIEPQVCALYLRNEHPNLKYNMPTVGWGNMSLTTAADLWSMSWPNLAVTRKGVDQPLSNPFTTPAMRCHPSPIYGSSYGIGLCELHAPSEVQGYQRLGRQLLDPDINIEYVAANLERGAIARQSRYQDASPFFAALWHGFPAFALEDLGILEGHADRWGNAALIVQHINKPLKLWRLTSNWQLTPWTEPGLFRLAPGLFPGYEHTIPGYRKP
jgi:RHS repeat-associated protein